MHLPDTKSDKKQLLQHTCTPEIALTKVDLPWATWPMVPAKEVTYHTSEKGKLYCHNCYNTLSQILQQSYANLTSTLILAQILPYTCNAWWLKNVIWLFCCKSQLKSDLMCSLILHHHISCSMIHSQNTAT